MVLREEGNENVDEDSQALRCEDGFADRGGRVGARVVVFDVL